MKIIIYKQMTLTIDDCTPVFCSLMTGISIGIFLSAKVFQKMKYQYDREYNRYMYELYIERKKANYVRYINKYVVDPEKQKDPYAHINEDDCFELIDPFEEEKREKALQKEMEEKLKNNDDKTNDSDEIGTEKDVTKENDTEVNEEEKDFDGKYVVEKSPQGKIYMMHEKDHIFHYWAEEKNVRFVFLHVVCRKLVLACDHKELYDEGENKYILKGNIDDFKMHKKKEEQLKKHEEVRDVSFRDFLSLRNRKSQTSTNQKEEEVQSDNVESPQSTSSSSLNTAFGMKYDIQKIIL